MLDRFLFEAIGTHWQIDFETSNNSDKNDLLLQEIKVFIDKFDKDYSRFRSDSLVTKISKKKGKYKFPKNAKKMFEFYKALYRLTNGAVTPLIGQVMIDSGYDANYSLISKNLKRPPKWEEVIDYDYPNLEVREKIMLDFGACGKGYLVDLVSDILINNKINKFFIDAGGDIYCNNFKQTIGLEHPDDTSQIVGKVDINNESICGSAGNRRKWGNFHHIINPHSLKPVVNIKAVWVISEETIIADGIATALFFVSPEKLMSEFKFSYLIVNNDLTFRKSDNFNGEIFIREV